MQEDDSLASPEHTSAQQFHNTCKNCGIMPSVDGKLTQLCHECRSKFIKYPIPAWIWFFTAGIGIVMIAGLCRMPKYLTAAVHQARGEKAAAAHRYATAQKEFEQVVALFPDDIPANGRLLIAAAYNVDLPAAGKANDHVANRQIEDKDLYNDMKEALAFLESVIPQDTLIAKRVDSVKTDPKALEALYLKYDSTSADRELMGYLVADRLFELKQYDRSKAVLEKVLSREPNNYLAQVLMIPVDRELGDYDGAKAICSKMLERNKEDMGVIVSEARIELKRKHDADAEKYAREAFAINDHSPMSQEIMAMVYHYKGNGQESNKLLAQIRAEEKADGDSTISTRLSKILDGTESYR